MQPPQTMDAASSTADDTNEPDDVVVLSEYGNNADRVTGSPRPSEPNGFGGAPEENAALRFVPERKRNTVSRLNDETDEWAEQEELAAQAEQMLVLKDLKHKDALLSRLNTFRRNRAFCDVVLFVDGREILAHKAVLAAISPPLFDMFLGNSGTDEDDHTLLPAQALALAKAAANVASSSTNGEQQPSQNGQQNGGGGGSCSSVDGGPDRMAYFEFSQSDYDCLEALVEFAYTARLRIGSRRVTELYRTAFALQVFPVAMASARWLAEHLSIANCIGIRRQANVNEDNFLLGRVDAFITDHFEAVVNESVEFSKLPCIRTRVIVPTVGANGNGSSGNDIGNGHNNPQTALSGEELAERCLRYFQLGANRVAGERVDTHIDALAEKTHLLVASDAGEATPVSSSTSNNGIIGTKHSIGTLQDANELDEKSSLGSCDLVKDYKRSKNTKGTGKKKLTKPEPAHTHHVTGATAVKLTNAGHGRMLKAQRDADKFASHESLCSLSSCSAGSVADGGSSGVMVDELVGADGCRCICVLPTSSGFWVCLALLFHRLVRISIHLSDDEELIRSSRTTSVASSTDGEVEASANALVGSGSDERIVLADSLDTMISINGSGSIADARERSPLPSIGEARCAIGAAFVGGKILIAGGYDRNICLKSVEELDIEGGGGDADSATAWRPLQPMCHERARFDASSVVDGKVYAVAGSNGTNDLCSCEVYDPSTGRWTEVRPLERARSYNGCASLNGLLYCIGGCSDQTILADCARYDPAKDEWTTIASLNTQRSQASCTAWNGMVVAVGGSDRWNCLDSVEAYDPLTDQWRPLARLRTPRRGSAVAVLGSSLYVIGGHDGTSALASVEVLDAPGAQWRVGPPLHSARVHHHAVSSTGDGASIFVIGGFNGTQFLASMEVLESEKTGWRGWREKRKGGNGAKLMVSSSAADTQDGEGQQQQSDPGTANTTPTPRAF